MFNDEEIDRAVFVMSKTLIDCGDRKPTEACQRIGVEDLRRLFLLGVQAIRWQRLADEPTPKVEPQPASTGWENAAICARSRTSLNDSLAIYGRGGWEIVSAGVMGDADGTATLWFAGIKRKLV